MNKYVKSFLTRGLAFGGFGPIVAGIIYAVLQSTLPEFYLSGTEVCFAVISTYFLAFIQAGASVFNQIEHWPVIKSLLFHFLAIYIAYAGCYVINSWIPFVPEALLIFTLIFVVIYVVIWVSVYIIIKLTSKRFNSKLN